MTAASGRDDNTSGRVDDAGGLIISGGGSVIVASDALRVQAAGLRELVGALGEVKTMVNAISEKRGAQWYVAVDAPISAQAADRAMVDAMGLITRSRAEAERLATMVHLAMVAYGVGEEANERLTRLIAGKLGFVAGRLAPLLAVIAVPLLGFAALGAFLGGLVKGQSPREVVSGLGVWVREHNDLLSDPLTVDLVRAAMHGTDDALGGLLGLPPEVVTLLGDDEMGVIGLSTAAAVVVVAGRSVGLLTESGVEVTRATSSPTTPPGSLAGRAGRIPEPSPAAPAQVRIDRYSTPGEPDRFEVYIGGTADFGLVAGDEPWDMTSNVSTMAGMGAASPEAVREAMAQAGITAESAVVITGYSQGALVAAEIVASQEYNVRAVVQFGAPTGFMELPADVAALRVRHAEDVVDAIGGNDVSPNTLIVERAVFAGGPAPNDQLFPAHQLDYYIDTAARVDDAGSAVLDEFLAELDGFAHGKDGSVTSATSTTYEARRVAAG